LCGLDYGESHLSHSFPLASAAVSPILEISIQNGVGKIHNAVFIRAPIIRKIWGTCEVLATIEKEKIGRAHV
jgi:glutamine amidotransferase PdxT